MTRLGTSSLVPRPSGHETKVLGLRKSLNDVITIHVNIIFSMCACVEHATACSAFLIKPSLQRTDGSLAGHTSLEVGVARETTQMASKEAEKFIRILASQLSEGMLECSAISYPQPNLL